MSDLETKIRQLEEEVKKNSTWRKISQVIISVTIVVAITYLLYILGNIPI